MSPTRLLSPDQASTMAEDVDALLYFLVAVSGVMSLLIAGLILYFGIKYRRRSAVIEPMRNDPMPAQTARRMEALWIVGPLAVSLVMFFWGAKLFAGMITPPSDAKEVFVVGQQWMWKIQHLEGQREINELHVPLGRATKLVLTSEDVIHSFYIPAFRIKSDAVPGRYTTLWFQPTKAGTYHLFCAEYCGTKHSAMIGRIVVMEPSEFQEWLGRGGEGSLASAGQKLFQDLGCGTCHLQDTQGRGPRLQGVYGSDVALASGDVVRADEAYLRESILTPNAKVVAGFAPIMPTYAGQISEEGVVLLLAYLRSLTVPAERTGPLPAAPGWQTRPGGPAQTPVMPAPGRPGEAGPERGPASPGGGER